MYTAPIPVDDDLRVAALYRYGILDTEREQAYEDITSLAAYICQAPFSTITLVDRDRQFFKSELNFGTRESNRDDGFCACAVLQPDIMVIEDTLYDARFVDNPFVTGGPQIRFYAGAPLITPDGFVLGTVCVFDTVPRKLADEQRAALVALSRQAMGHMELRRQMMEGEKQAVALRTAEKLAVVGRLASSMAHEINNPLQSVTNLLYVSAFDMPDGMGKECLAQAQDELTRVTHIVTQALRFHSQSEKAAPARLGDIAESVVALFNTRLRHASIKVSVVDRQQQLLTCLASDLRQVVANLMSNALDAVQAASGGEIRISVRDAVDARSGAAGVRLTVADDGCGMEAATERSLFEPFFSTKGARGTGLGLWVSRGILDKHRATVRVRSATAGARRGTTFSVFFPHDSAVFGLPR